MAIPADAFGSIQKYFNSQSMTAPNMGPSAAHVANYMLLNAQRNTLGPGTPQNNDPSIMGRIFDILSRPNYAIANMFKGAAEHHNNNLLKDFISGLAGTQKTTFSDVLQSAGMPDTPATKLLGMGLDIGLDPTTYVSGKGVVNGIRDIAGLGKTGEKVARELPLGGKLLQGGKEAINPEAFGLPAKASGEIPAALKSLPSNIPAPLGKTVDELAQTATKGAGPQQLALDLPGIKKSKVTIPESLLKTVEDVPPVGKEIKGQGSLRFPDFNLSKIREATELDKVKRAEDIVSGVTQGNLEDALKITPPVPLKYKPSDAKLAEELAKRFDPKQSTALLNKQHPNSLNAKQQVKLYYRVRETLAKQGPKSANRTNAVYKAVEDQMVKRGYIPRIGTGENVKLSDVIADLKSRGVKADYDNLKEFGSEISKSTPVGQAVEHLRARGAITESVPIKNIVDKISESKAQLNAANVLSNTQLKGVQKLLKKFGKTTAKAQNLSPAAENATKGLIEQAMVAGKSPAEIMLSQKSKMLDDIVAGGKTRRAEINKVVTMGLEKSLGKLPKWIIDEDANKAVDFAMGRVATWWGQKDLRPATLEALASSAATASMRGNVLNNIFKDFDLSQRSEAFRLAQNIGQPSTPATAQLGSKIAQIMSDLTEKAGGASVLVKSSVDMDLLNKWMRRYQTGFEFTNKTLKDPVTKELRDFSKGADWLESWKAAEIAGDPAQWLFKFQQAAEQATREKSVFDELGERFGSQIAGNGYRVKIDGHPYLKDYFFPDEIAKQIPRMVKDWNPGSLGNGALLKLYDRGLSMWKTNVTIYKPGFHVRNVVGDMYLGALDGVTSVKPYRLALRVQRTMKGHYEDLNDIDKLVEIGAISKSARTPMPGEVLFTNKSGVKFTAEQIYAVAHQKGLFESYKTLEDIIDTDGKKFRPFGGKVQAAAGSLSELQHVNSRLAHFIDKVGKSRGSDLPKIFEDASRRARRFHPSGLDLTEFEKKYMRRIMPFYSWIRKSTPLLLEGIVMRPGITLLPSKISQGIQEAAGVDYQGRDNPFPVDQMFPDWIKEQGLGPWSNSEGLLGKFSNQDTPGYVMGGMGLDPLTQLIPQLQHPGKTIGSSLTPLVKVPIELMTGTNIFSGAPISGTNAPEGAMQEYLGSQIPLASVFQGLTGYTPFGTETKRSGPGQRTEAFTNFLTGLGIKGTGPYIKSAQYSQRQVNRDEFLAQLKNQMGG